MKKITLALMTMVALCIPAQAQEKVKNIYTSGDALNLEALETPGQSTTLYRTLLAGYNSICLPMTLNADQLQKAAPGVQVERLAQIRQEGNTLTLVFLDCTAEGIQAGTPYLIFAPKLLTLKASSTLASAISTQLRSITKTDNQGNQITFGSSWESLRVEGRYGIPAQQAEHTGAYRCRQDLPAHQMRIHLGQTSTHCHQPANQARNLAGRNGDQHRNPAGPEHHREHL